VMWNIFTRYIRRNIFI